MKNAHTNTLLLVAAFALLIFLHPHQLFAQSTDEAAEKVRVDKLVAELEEQLKTMDYQQAEYHPLHFPPLIDEADDRQCLVCHSEILERKVLERSPAGVEASSVLAWYQTLNSYEGEQMTFHQRHITSPFAQEVMDLSCNFCHRGHDPREEHTDMMDLTAAPDDSPPRFTLRKLVNPSETCLLCHGEFPDAVGIMTLPGPWHESQKLFEPTEESNGCLACHGAAFRSVRHQVTYLKADAIEEASKTDSDVCYGCHGGRSWFGIAYPYARNKWPLMSDTVPEWAVDRPTQSDPRYVLTK